MWNVSGRFLSRIRQRVLLRLGFLLYGLLLFLAATLMSACGGPPQNESNDGEGPARITLSSESTQDLGRVLMGFETEHPLVLTNTSLSATANTITISEGFVMPYTFTGGMYPGQGGSCSDSLPPGESCTLIISIIPQETGTFTESFTISYNDGVNNQSTSFQLTALSYEPQPALLTISDGPSFDFGRPAIGGNVEKIFTVTNSGDLAATDVLPLPLGSPFSFIGGTFPGLGGDCEETIEAGLCTIAVRFTPTDTLVANGVISMSYHDGHQSRNTERSVTGQGRVAANLLVQEGLTFNLGTLLSGATTDLTLTLENNGGEPATGISLAGLGSGYSRTGGNCSTTLTSGGICTIQLRFSPTATADYPSTPTLSYNDSFLVQTLNINLSGQGYAGPLSLSRSLPTTNPNTIATPTLRVSNLVPSLTVRLYRDSGCTQIAGTAISSGTSLDFSPTLTEGSFLFRATLEDEYGNITPCSTASAPYTYDNTNPNPVTAVTMGADFTSSATTTPSFSWNHSPSADRADYEVGLDANASGGNSEAGWISKGLPTSTTITGLSLSECSYYYASVRVIDQANLISPIAVATSRFRYDSAIPTAPASLNTAGDATATNTATVSWSPSSDNCGISHYEIAIGEDLNGNLTLDPGEEGNVVPFKSVGLVTSYRENGISLNTATNYYTSVRAVDTTNRISSTAVSAPYIIYDPSIELPDMIVWLDAGDPTTIFDGAGRDANHASFSGTVDTWIDKSGSDVDHDFSTTGGNVDAPFNDTTYALEMNGSSTGLMTANHPEINTATVTQRNITVAFQTSSNITSRQTLYEEGGSIRGMNVYIYNGRIYCGFFNTPTGDGDGAQPFTHVNRTISPNTTYFVTWVFDYTNYTGPAGPDGNLDCYVNDDHIGNAATTSRLFAHSGAVGLGHVNSQTCFEDDTCPSSGSHFLGNLYEVMIFNNAPDPTDVSNVHTYLDNKWN